MGQFPEMFRIAQVIQSSGVYNPIIYFNLGISGAHPNVRLCLDSGIDVLDYSIGYTKGVLVQNKVYIPFSSPVLDHQSERPNFLSLKLYLLYRFPRGFDLARRFVHRMKKNILQLPRFAKRVIVKLKRMRREKSFFKTLKIDLMIFAEDSEDYFTPQLIQLGHDLGIKSVVFPYTFANQFEFLESALFQDLRTNESFLNLITGKLFPKWTHKYKGVTLLKSTPSFIFSTELFGKSAPNPWVMSSGYSDLIAVESEFMKNYYQKAGLPEQKMREVGYPSLDHIFEVFKNRDSYRLEFARRYELDIKKPWVICAVAPSQWPRAGAGFKSYQQFLSDYLSFLTQNKDVEVIFKFHPRLNATEVRALCEQLNVKYVPEDTAELIAVGDAYLATVSSTIRWALALGLPTINYDLYQYNYGDFEGAKNYEVVFLFEDFKKSFERLRLQLVNSFGKEESVLQKEYSLIDGQVRKRILELCDQFMRQDLSE